MTNIRLDIDQETESSQQYVKEAKTTLETVKKTMEEQNAAKIAQEAQIVSVEGFVQLLKETIERLSQAHQ